MNEITISQLKIQEYPFIERTEDKSDIYIKRMRIHFKNGKQLSIVKGYGTYGNDQGLFEIALFNERGQMSKKLLDKEDRGNNVLGHCTIDKVKHYIEKIGTL